MDIISTLPIEVLEEIFLYLGTDDLIRCTYVSLQWREVINSNKIWSVQCSRKKILHKEYLQVNWSFISNPAKVFRDHVYDTESTNLTPPCHWRSHFDRYKFLKRNWRKGNFSLIRTNVETEHYKDGLLISMGHNRLAAYSIHNLNNPMYIKKVEPTLEVDAVRIKDNFLFYTQESRLVCMKKKNSGFIQNYVVNLSENLNQHSNHRSATEPMLVVKITDYFMVIQNLTNACFLHFYDYKTGEFEKQVNLHTYSGRSCPQFTCLEAFGEKVFIAYSLIRHYILIYDYKLDKVDIKVESSLRSSELVVSKNFFCTKLTYNRSEKSCELHVWSVHTGEEVYILNTYRQLPFHLTLDDKLIYSDQCVVYVRGMIDSSQDVKFSIKGRLQGMESVWGDLLVLNLGYSLQLWDISSGQKLHTYMRDSVEDMWVDDRHIVVRLSNRPWLTTAGYVIGFW